MRRTLAPKTAMTVTKATETIDETVTGIVMSREIGIGTGSDVIEAGTIVGETKMRMAMKR